MVPAYSVKVPRVSTYSGYRHVNSPFAYGAFTLSGWLSQNHSARLIESITRSEPQYARTLVWALPISLAATFGITVVFSSSGYLDVSVHRVPFHSLWIGLWILEVFSSRFPHSEISGSQDICSSPKLFAAYHVFHRLLVPRHPPYALISITNLPSPTGWALAHTCIALHALVLGQFLLSLFSSDWIIVNVVNVTSDVLIDILYLIIYFFVCSFQGTYEMEKSVFPFPSLTDIHQSLEPKTLFKL